MILASELDSSSYLYEINREVQKDTSLQCNVDTFKISIDACDSKVRQAASGEASAR